MGRTFYVVLEGLAGVLVPDKETKGMKEVNVMSAGQSFGELSLLTEQPRNATVYCKTDCHFVVLHKEDYTSIVGRFDTDVLQQRLAKIRIVQFFSTWTRNALMKFAYFFNERHYIKKQFVFQEGDLPDEVFIVIQGEVKLVKTLQVKQAHAILLRRTKSVQIEIAVMGIGQVFGEEDLFVAEANSRERQYGVIANSMTLELLAINRADFLRRVQGNKATAYFTKKCEERIRLHNRRIEAMSAFYRGYGNGTGQDTSRSVDSSPIGTPRMCRYHTEDEAAIGTVQRMATAVGKSKRVASDGPVQRAETRHQIFRSMDSTKPARSPTRGSLRILPSMYKSISRKSVPVSDEDALARRASANRVFNSNRRHILVRSQHNLFRRKQSQSQSP